jgi:triphosphoribosyl-dephospho-CoA synthase
VAGEPTITLLEAMRIAADRDRIARQYVTGYSDVFGLGLPAYQEALDRGWDAAWASVSAYLRFMAAFPDTHIAREWGAAVAEQVRLEAGTVETRLKACENPRTAVPMLLSFDKKLKEGGLNPGTSADLTVATLAAFRLEALLNLE